MFCFARNGTVLLRKKWQKDWQPKWEVWRMIGLASFLFVDYRRPPEKFAVSECGLDGSKGSISSPMLRIRVRAECSSGVDEQAKNFQEVILFHDSLTAQATITWT